MTFGGEMSPEVLAIHPEFRGTHMPLNWLRRQYENKTGEPFDTLAYIFLTAQNDGKGKFSQVMLDFSRADGGVLEYTPPVGWPHGNLLRRILYSMNFPPVGGYQKNLPLYLDQKASPYGMGTTFFYCQIQGHYGAGKVNTNYDFSGKQQQAHVQIWLNREKNDPRVRYQ